VLLPDELMGDSSLLRDLIADHEAGGWSSIGVVSVPRELTSSYGCVSLAAPLVDGRARITDVVEKPNPADAPSDLAIVGRYVLEADIFAALVRLTPAKNGELQLSDALAARAREGRAGVVVARCTRHDTGTPLGMLTAVVDRTLARPDVGASLRTWLTQRLSQP
jgi:UTP--glucose-1-phosphate uridylyltransferase